MPYQTPDTSPDTSPWSSVSARRTAQAAVALAALAVVCLTARPAQAQTFAGTDAASTTDPWASVGADLSGLPVCADTVSDDASSDDASSDGGAAPRSGVFGSGGVTPATSFAALSLITGLFALFSDHGSRFTPGTSAFPSAPGASSIALTPPGAPVPEASQAVSLGLLLAFGLGGVVAAKRKKAAEPRKAASPGPWKAPAGRHPHG